MTLKRYLFKAPPVCEDGRIVFLLRENSEGMALLISFWKIYMGMQRRLILGKTFPNFSDHKIYGTARCEAFNLLCRGLKAFAKSYIARSLGI